MREKIHDVVVVAAVVLSIVSLIISIAQYYMWFKSIVFQSVLQTGHHQLYFFQDQLFE